MNNLFNLNNLSNAEIKSILDLALLFKHKQKEVDYQQKKIVVNCFFEPSTRTQYSFDIAANRLGCKTINFVAENSALKKGETLYDTIKTFEALGVDLCVIRHQKDNYYQQLAGTIKMPIINAGDGVSNHPTQSLLDLLTIYETFANFKNLKVLIVGDIKHSRVAKTNIQVMQRLGMKIMIAGPKSLIITNVKKVKLTAAIGQVDIVMLLRYQFERFSHDEKYHENYLKQYQLTTILVAKMKKTAIILHPAPFNRGWEIADEVVECEKSRIFEQMHNGVFIRMALIDLFLSQSVSQKNNLNPTKKEMDNINHDYYF